MASGQRYAGFFSGQILGLGALRDYVLGYARNYVKKHVGATIGEAVLDPSSGGGITISTTYGTHTINNRKLSLVGDRWCHTENGDLLHVGDGTAETTVEGSRTIKTHDPAWFADLPFENANGTTYYIFVRGAEVPVDVAVGKTGVVNYSNFMMLPGFQVTPNSVVSGTGGNAELIVDAALTSLGMARWLTSNHENNNWSYDCVAWLDTSVSGVTLGSSDPDALIIYGKLVKRDPADGTGWVFVTGSKFGQSTISTVAARYKLVVLGPLISTSSSKQTDPDWVYIGSVASATGSETTSTAGQAVLVPYATYTAGFSVEHFTSVGTDLGRHKSVTAPEDEHLEIMVDSALDRQINIGNQGSGSSTVRVLNELHASELRGLQDTDDIEVNFDNANTRTLRVRNIESGYRGVVEAGELVATLDDDGNGDVVSSNHFKYDNTVRVPVETSVIDAIKAYFSGSAGGGGTLQFNGGGGSVNHIYLTGGTAAIHDILVPVSLPDGFVVKQMALRAYRDAAGAPNVEAKLAFWDESSTSVTTIASTAVVSTASGAWSTTTLTLGSPYTVVNAVGRQWYVSIVIQNNGIANDTARFARLTVSGQPAQVQSLGF